MLVYGDPWRNIEISTWRERMAEPVRAATRIEAHAEFTSRLIESGQVLQALEDLAFAAGGEQDRDRVELRPLRDCLLAMARAIGASWLDRSPPDFPPAPQLPAFSPSRLRAREPEGYAFYALYPESYFEAARRLALPHGAVVIGLRSIGASLAPMAAAGLGARDFATLRPKGPPFAREIEAPDLATLLARAPGRDVAIVDEGPGLSGSSFAATARFVRSADPARRIHLLPSHPHGPGAAADDETRALFRAAPSHVVSFDELALGSGRLARWVEDLTGPLLGPPEDISGGGWRRRHYDTDKDWPAADLMQERRKFLVESRRGRFLLKFIGLGDIGARKAALAGALGREGLAPETLGFRHGFLVERWRGDARPAQPLRDREQLLPALARYLAFRQRRFPLRDAYGASLSELREMAVRNASLALGAAAGARADRMMREATAHENAMLRIATDNRMHAHEWLVAPGGVVLKTDGVDHHAGHDLIGAQDIAYDIAGAAVELLLGPDEVEELCRQFESHGGRVERRLLHPMRVAWLAFETGRFALAVRSNAGSPEESRLGRRLAALTQRLDSALSGAESSTIRELQSQPVVWPT